MFGLSNFIITEFLLIFYSLVTNVLYSYILLHALIFYEIYYNIWYTIANIVVEIYEIWQEKYKNGYIFTIFIKYVVCEAL